MSKKKKPTKRDTGAQDLIAAMEAMARNLLTQSRQQPQMFISPGVMAAVHETLSGSQKMRPMNQAEKVEFVKEVFGEEFLKSLKE